MAMAALLFLRGAHRTAARSRRATIRERYEQFAKPFATQDAEF